MQQIDTSRPATGAAPPADDDHVRCGCDDTVADPWRYGFTRRKLLQGGAALAVAPLARQLVTTRMAFAQEPAAATNTVVVVFLRGGADGLSFVVPHGDPDYAGLRGNLAVPRSRLGHADELFGLHPGLAGPLGKYWQSGRFGAIQGVAIEQPDYSHEQATRTYERGATADIGSGWANRFSAAGGTASPFEAVAFGGGLPGSLQGPGSALALRSLDGFALRGPDPAALATTLGRLYDEPGHPAHQPVTATLGALATAEQVAATPYEPAVTYPEGGFAGALREVARVKKAGIGLQVACVDVGGWDTHTRMGDGGDANGDMYRHIADLGAALGAFCDDLGDALSTTTIVTCSEFGRRARRNDSGGTDHGYGNAMLAIGAGVVGGRVHGRWPGLADEALVGGNLAKAVDYRDVLAELCIKRGGVGSAQTVFPGHQYAELGVFTRA